MTESSLTEKLLWLCNIPSLIGEERELCDRVVERLGATSLAGPIRRYGDSIVVPLTRGTGGPHVALAGHLDVVRTQHDGPPRIDGERLYAPGAADMKSGLCLMLDLAEQRARPAVDVTLVFYAREEGPFAENELGPVLEQDPELSQVVAAVALEPSDNKLQLGCSGSIHAKVTFRGKTAHSARPWQGENAIHKASALLARLGALEPKTQVVDGMTWRGVISATMAGGGRGRNVVPDAFEINLNQRFGPATNVDTAKAEVLELVSGEADVEFVDVSPSALPHRTHPLIQALGDSGVLAIEPKQAWTDVARFAGLGIPAANFGPGTQAQAHQRNEWTHLPGLEIGKNILWHWLERIARLAPAALVILSVSALSGCNQSRHRAETGRSEAVARGAEPSLLERARLAPAVAEVLHRFKASDRLLVVDIDSKRLLVQAEDAKRPGHVLQHEYQHGAFGPVRAAELKGSGELAPNLFPLAEIKLESVLDLLGAAVEEVDPQNGRVSRVVIRRHLPDSEQILIRVFVQSPRLDGYIDADGEGRPL